MQKKGYIYKKYNLSTKFYHFYLGQKLLISSIQNKIINLEKKKK